jgi:hypothetical protein
VVARGELAHLLCSAIIGVCGVAVLECLVNETGITCRTAQKLLARPFVGSLWLFVSLMHEDGYGD